MELEDLISQRIETLEGMLKEEFIALSLEVNLAVINGYKMNGHTLQQLEREKVHAYGGGQFLGTATTTETACKDSAAFAGELEDRMGMLEARVVCGSA